MEAFRLCNSCIVNEQKTKEVQGQGPLNINLSLFVYFLMFTSLPNHFPLLTMVLLSYFSRYGTWRADVRMYGQSRDQIE